MVTKTNTALEKALYVFETYNNIKIDFQLLQPVSYRASEKNGNNLTKKKKKLTNLKPKRLDMSIFIFLRGSLKLSSVTIFEQQVTDIYNRIG